MFYTKVTDVTETYKFCSVPIFTRSFFKTSVITLFILALCKLWFELERREQQ